MKLLLLVLALLMFPGVAAMAQDSLFKETPYNELRDVMDAFKKKHHDSITETHKLQVSVLPAAGYTIQTGFAGVVSANAAFYTNHDPKTKISSVFWSCSYSQYHQTIMPMWTNIWSKNGKWNYVADWRYMKYPSTTWGLGGRRDPVDGFTINFSYIKLHQILLFNVRKNLFVGTGLYYDRFWNIREVDATNLTTFQRYGLNVNERAVGIPVRVLFDSRLNQINPKNGFYMSLTYTSNIRSIGSYQNWQSIVGDIRKYIRFPASSDNILALWSYTWLTQGKGPDNKVPYLLLPSTGWDDFFNIGRGYIQGRYRSHNMVYFESEYRFKILRSGLLGGVAFANIESFQLNLLQAARTQYAPGAGVGLRVKLNKNSGTNLAIDYGFGKGGSQGFFINLGEVF